MTPNIPLLGWSPDSDPTQPGVLVDVENLLPTVRGYAPEFALGASTWASSSLPSGDVCGAALVSFSTNSPLPIVANSSDIYAVSSGLFNAITRASPAYSGVSPVSPWRFASFGDKLLAAHTANTLQISTTNPLSALRDAVGGPKAATIAVQRGFVVLGAYQTGASPVFDGWICSALEDPEDWTPDIATQCATGQLTATPGVIIRMISFRDYVVAFKQRGVYRGTYVGAADNTWSWPVVSTEVGLWAPDGVCEAEGVLYWVGGDGFYRWAGGAIERIRSAPFEWLVASVGGLAGLARVQATWDNVRRVVRFLVPYVSTNDVRLCLAYHPDTDRWGKSVLDVQWMLGATQDTLPIINGSTGYLRYMTTAYIRMNRAFASHSGGPTQSSMASTFTTGDIGDDDQAFALTRARARFLQAPTTSTAQHFYRMNSDDALTTGETVSRTDGKYDISQSARWHRLKFSQTGRYEVTGFSVDTPKAGKR